MVTFDTLGISVITMSPQWTGLSRSRSFSRLVLVSGGGGGGAAAAAAAAAAASAFFFFFEPLRLSA
jgi:hypothetical protein